MEFSLPGPKQAGDSALSDGIDLWTHFMVDSEWNSFFSVGFSRAVSLASRPPRETDCELDLACRGDTRTQIGDDCQTWIEIIVFTVEARIEEWFIYF